MKGTRGLLSSLSCHCQRRGCGWVVVLASGVASDEDRARARRHRHWHYHTSVRGRGCGRIAASMETRSFDPECGVRYTSTSTSTGCVKRHSFGLNIVVHCQLDSSAPTRESGTLDLKKWRTQLGKLWRTLNPNGVIYFVEHFQARL